jgi:hypothetical protein
LASVEWKQKFPLVTVQALTRSGLDYTSLLIDLGNQALIGKISSFSFKLSQLRQDGFYDMVSHGDTPH